MESPRRKPTMIDVATLAGTSHMTVSRFLRGDQTIRTENRERIAAAIKELGYRPNLVARSMRMRQRGLLAIIVPATVNAYSPARILAAATALAHEAGFEVETVSVEGGSEARTRRALELSDSRLVEGVLSLAPLDNDLLASSGTAEVPVLVDVFYDDDLNGVGPLLDAAPITTMVEHLADMGHERFFHVGGPVTHPASIRRKEAYLQAIERLGLSSCGVWQQDWSGSSGVNAITSLENGCGVTAVICANDELAAGAIKGATDRGWAVPEDVSVTGWDNSPLGEFMPPGLSTVYVDHVMLGRRAMRRVIAAIRGETGPEEDLSRLNTIIWRGSVSPRHTARG
jgi:LacI family transcriptional regulator, repressor for deo operon, udp, cdd, tsx, nupC, and nupG